MQCGAETKKKGKRDKLKEETAAHAGTPLQASKAPSPELAVKQKGLAPHLPCPAAKSQTSPPVAGQTPHLQPTAPTIASGGANSDSPLDATLHPAATPAASSGTCGIQVDVQPGNMWAHEMELPLWLIKCYEETTRRSAAAEAARLIAEAVKSMFLTYPFQTHILQPDFITLFHHSPNAHRGAALHDRKSNVHSCMCSFPASTLLLHMLKGGCMHNVEAEAVPKHKSHAWT